MKLMHLGAAALLTACTTLPTGQSSTIPTLPGSLPLAQQAQKKPQQPKASTSSSQHDLIQAAEAQIQSQSGQDRLVMQVMLGRPATGFRTQALELSRITSLRAWAKGPGIQNQIWNQGDHVNVNTTGNTSLQIQQVPRGKNRVVSVAGYELKDEAQQSIPGALLKAVYDSPADSYEITLYFTWRSTALANVIEKLQETAPELLENDNLKEDLGDFIDTLIYGDTIPSQEEGQPEGSQYKGPYIHHPAQIDTDAIAEHLVQEGELPSPTPADPWLKSTGSKKVSANALHSELFVDSTIQVQITDPSSAIVSIDPGDSNETISGVVPGDWEAIFTIDGPLGSVETRVPVTFDDDGNLIFPEGGDEANPAQLPPIIKGLYETPVPDDPSKTQLIISGDGFNNDPTQSGGNQVFINGEPVPVESVTYTDENGTPTLIVTLADELDEDAIITVAHDGRTDKPSNEATYTPLGIISLDEYEGTVGDFVTITVKGFTPTIEDKVYFSDGEGGTVGGAIVTGVTGDTITVQVPEGAVTGQLIVEPDSLDDVSLLAPTYTVAFPPIITSTSGNPESGNTVTLRGDHFTGATVCIGQNCLTEGVDYEIVSDDEILLKNVNTPITELIYVKNSKGTAMTFLDYTYSNVVNYIGNKSQLAVGDDSHVKDTTVIKAPHGINVDQSGNIYVADLGVTEFGGWVGSSTCGNNAYRYAHNHAIHKFKTDGTFEWSSGSGVNKVNEETRTTYSSGLCYWGDLISSVLVDAPGAEFAPPGYQNGSIENALFSSPEDIANDAAGNIYVADTANHAIRKIDTAGNVTTIARVPGPEGLQVGPDGDLYITANYPHNPTNTDNMIFAGVLRVSQNKLSHSIVDTQESFAVSESSTVEQIIAQINNADVISGGGSDCSRTNTADEALQKPIDKATYCHVEGIGMDGAGNVYVADVDNFQLRKLHALPSGTLDPKQGKVSILADVCGTAVNAAQGSDCKNTQYSLEKPYIYMHEIRVDRAGHVFIPANIMAPALGIYKVSPQGNISLVAGRDSSGLAEGDPLSVATFSDPRGVDFGPDGSLYVADTAWGVRKVERLHPVEGLQMP